MKKKLLMIVAVVAMTVVAANAQPRAIGVNLGSGLGFSYQHGFGEANMLAGVSVVSLLTIGSTRLAHKFLGTTKANGIGLWVLVLPAVSMVSPIRIGMSV